VDEPGLPVTISEGLAVGLLMLLQYLTDDWGKLPPEIVPVVIRLNDASGMSRSPKPLRRVTPDQPEPVSLRNALDLAQAR